MNISKAVDEHVETELAEARDAADALMEQTVAAYQRVTELMLARDLRRALGATLRPVSVPDVLTLKREASA